MPNAIILPYKDYVLRTRIPQLINVVHGFPGTEHKLGTNTGTAPLEQGATVTDHAEAKPEQLNLVGWVSDLEAAGPAAAITAWDAIRKLNQDSEPVKVITGAGTYDEMLITEAVAPQRGRGLRFTMRLEQIIRVGVMRETIVAGSGPAQHRLERVSRGFVISPMYTGIQPKATFGGGDDLATDQGIF